MAQPESPSGESPIVMISLRRYAETLVLHSFSVLDEVDDWKTSVLLSIVLGLEFIGC
jgi:hypothetical protein